jgi:hypothetical protein
MIWRHLFKIDVIFTSFIVKDAKLKDLTSFFYKRRELSKLQHFLQEKT